ncbi:MAG: PEP-CTERM sorting domain-containing protein [Desulfobacterales bacterium]|nr:PEP-CTERM sorting domain-containing protein [Desulfobacterales bacterium]
MKRILGIMAVLFFLLSTSALAATITLFDNDAAGFDTATAGSSFLTQDFEAFDLTPPGPDLEGATVLSGVVVSSNFDELTVFNSSFTGNQLLFGLSSSLRPLGSYYNISLTGGYNTVSFTVESWEFFSPSEMVVTYDGGEETFFITKTSTVETDPVFIGLVSDTAITNIRWIETQEGTNLGSEEVGLDNIRVSSSGSSAPIPEPSTMLLFGVGLLGFAGANRRKE